MWKTVFFILLLGIASQKIFAQNIEQNILELLFNDIKKQNEYCLIKEKMKGASLVSDPISGEREIKYSTNIDPKTKAEFSKFTKKEQIKILSCKDSLAFLNDTLVIVDTIGFFSEGNVTFNQGKAVICIVRKNTNKIRPNSIVLFAVGLRDSSLIVTLTRSKRSVSTRQSTYFPSSFRGLILLKKEDDPTRTNVCPDRGVPAGRTIG